MRKPVELLNAHFDGEALSPAEGRRLSDWVNAHPDNARAVVQMGMIHEMTDSILSVPRLLDQLSLTSDPAVQRSIGESLDWIESRPAPGARTAALARRHAPGSRWFAVSSAMLAASLLLAVSTLLLDRGGTVARNDVGLAEVAPQPALPIAEPLVATVLDVFDVQWSEGRPAYRGMHIRRLAPIDISDGVLALTTSTGCDVVVQGPASLVFEDEDRIRLDRGRLTARISDEAAQIVVETPTARVVDLGTEFGVSVTDALETSVAVYEGVVELTSRNSTDDSDELQTRTLQAGRSGYVDGQGQLRWTIETLPHEREFIRPDEIADLRDARRGSSQAKEQVCFYELQRIRGLLGFQGFDIPSGGVDRSLAFADAGPRSDSLVRFDRDIVPGRLHSSGSLLVEETAPVFLDLDTSPDSAFARAGLLTDRGMVGRSDTELWLAWRTRATDHRRPGMYAGLSVMFGGDRQFHEPLFLGTTDNNDRLAVVANVGSRAIVQKLVDGGELSSGDSPRLWVLRMVFGERADKVAVWCDVPPGETPRVRPHAEILNANLMFDRLRLGVGTDASPWLFDDLVIAIRPDALGQAVGLISGE
ncbi:FecR protein [Posidoniimonas corsicana]|uniref:FecR protein n=1 Tax=Posidoniimonas corsicana TaxID=1938618 RepID=A0A5C5UUN3_9BACT|nr:FecR protein [Posidoniimonas corsicana]